MNIESTLEYMKNIEFSIQRFKEYLETEKCERTQKAAGLLMIISIAEVVFHEITKEDIGKAELQMLTMKFSNEVVERMKKDFNVDPNDIKFGLT